MSRPEDITVGILGGGQLGRMLAISAAELGLNTHILSPEPFPVAGQVASRTTRAEFEDLEALQAFANSVDVVTFEFENFSAHLLDALDIHSAVFPGRNALSTSQDRLAEKEFLTRLGLDTAPYANVENEAELVAAAAQVGTPSILKTRTLGYDGKGQVRLSHPDQAREAWKALDNSACILEGRIDFKCELSVIATRSRCGEVVCFDPGENIHRDGILRTTTVPAKSVSEVLCERAIATANEILNDLDYVGTMGIEIFVTREDDLLINEIAPRVHNSGHWTQDGCIIDQFEQHIRAIVGFPLGSGARHSDVVMTNLIGDEVLDADDLLSDPNISLYLYGKSDVRPGRKMGHFNRVIGQAQTSTR
jgi:5-(carboxyamino)imidazole ribonucleotide synthase